MTAVFLFYARADRDLASRIVSGLKAAGLDAWWDEAMSGVDWRQAIERQIGEIGAIVALWTPASKDDPAFRDIARSALSAGKLVNVVVGDAPPPFPYGSAEGVSLDDATGAEHDPRWAKLVEMVTARAGQSPKETVRTIFDKPREVNDTQKGQTRESENQGADGAQNPSDGKIQSKVVEQTPPKPIPWLRARRIAAIVLVGGAVSIVVAVFGTMPSGHDVDLNATGWTALGAAYIMLALAYNLWKKI